MTAWEELKPVLARLRDQQPGVLARYPSLESDGKVTATVVDSQTGEVVGGFSGAQTCR